MPWKYSAFQYIWYYDNTMLVLFISIHLKAYHDNNIVFGACIILTITIVCDNDNRLLHDYSV